MLYCFATPFFAQGGSGEKQKLFTAIHRGDREAWYSQLGTLPCISSPQCAALASSAADGGVAGLSAIFALRFISKNLKLLRVSNADSAGLESRLLVVGQQHLAPEDCDSCNGNRCV